MDLESDSKTDGGVRRWWSAERNAVLSLAILAAGSLAFGAIALALYSPEPSSPSTSDTEKASPELTVEQRVQKKFGSLFRSTFESGGRDSGEYLRTLGVGGRKKPDYSITHADGWPLVGFNFCTSTYNRDGIIKVLQPIFRDVDTGELAVSERIGKLNPSCEFHQELAKPWCVVAGLYARGGVRLHAIKIIYCRLAEDGTIVEDQDDSDRYESNWYGGMGKSSPEGGLLGDDGGIVRGVCCSIDIDANKISLLSVSS